jgi:hypothetical protein
MFVYSKQDTITELNAYSAALEVKKNYFTFLSSKSWRGLQYDVLARLQCGKFVSFVIYRTNKR